MDKKPTFGSLFAGIGGFELGLERAGWECKWQVENDEFCNKILEKHWPNIKRYGDIENVKTEELETVDLICGGFPCQDLSIAGKREGLSGGRSGLFWQLVRLVRGLQPRWLLIENVPGWLSSHKGKDFAIALQTLAECGYGLAWRVLDSQYFGVPQRRRRVFIVGHLGAICPPEILFESQSDSKIISNREGKDSFPCSLPWAGGPSLERLAGCIIAKPVLGNIRGFGTGQQVQLVYQENNPFGEREASGIPRQMDLSVCNCVSTPRWRTLGNAVTVPVIEWIGKRIIKVME